MRARRKRRLNPRLLGKRWRRRSRWIWRVLIGGPLLVVGLGLLLMRSPLVGYLARGAIEPLLGCKMHASGVAISLDGRLILDELSLRVPGLDSEAGEFLYVRRAEADLDWAGLLRGEVNPTGLRLSEPVFRVSQSTTTGDLSIASLQPASQTKQRLTQPPKIDVIDGVIEAGEHTGSRAGVSYRELTTLKVSGSLEPTDPLRPVYTIRFQERLSEAEVAASMEKSAGGDGVIASRIGMVVNGTVDLDHSTASVRVMNVGVNPWASGSVPTYMREIWGRLNIQGRISEANLTYDPMKGPEAVITVDHASMNALVPASAHSGKTDDLLSLEQVVGTIRVSNSGVGAELDATVAGQVAPAHVSLDYGGLADDSPLRCVITTSALRVDKDPQWLAFTPIEVKENLAAFSGPTGIISGRVVIERGAPAAPSSRDGLAPGPSEPAPMRVSGVIDLREGTAAFHRVPYPFKDMTGHVEFDQDTITIARIDGRAASGATIHASGWIAPPDESAEISLHVVVDDVPLDQVFADSLPESRRGAMSFLFSPERYAALRRAGVISDAGARERAREERGEYERERARLLVVTPEDAERPLPDIEELQASLNDLSDRIDECERVMEASDFEMGGVADLDIQVHTPRGKSAPWEYTVGVSIPRAGFLLRGFPLPVVGRDVQIRLTQDDATLLGGRFLGINGGEFEVQASVVLDESGRAVVKPDVRIRAERVPIDHALLEAARGAVEGLSAGESDEAGRVAEAASPGRWGGAAGSLLRYLDFDGMVSCDVSLWPTGHETLDGRADVSFSGARLGPMVLGDGSRVWGENLDGNVRVEGDRLRVPLLRGDLRKSELCGTAARPVMVSSAAGGFHLMADATLASTVGDLLNPSGGGPARPSGPHEGAGGGGPGATAFARDASATLLLSGVDVSLDVSPIVGLISESGAEAMSRLFANKKPAGRVDGEVRAEVAGDGSGALHILVRDAHALSLEHESQRFTIDMDRGSIGVQTVLGEGGVGVGDSLVWFEDCGLRVHVEGETPIAARIDGVLDVADLGSSGASREAPPGQVAPSNSPRAGSEARHVHAWAGTRLAISTEDAAFESCLVRSLLETRLAHDTLVKADAADLRGRFGAEIVLASSAEDGAGTDGLSVAGTVGPRSVSFNIGVTRVDAPVALGEVNFDGGRVWTHGLGMAADAWQVGLQAQRTDLAGGGATLRVAAVARASSLTPDLRAMLPESVVERLDRNSLEISGGLELIPVVYTRLGGTGSRTESERLEGSLRFAQLKADAALSVRDATGRCDFVLWRESGAEDWAFDAKFSAPRLTLEGLDVRTLEARVLTGSTAEELLLPGLSAECYGGRITGSGAIEPAAAMEPGSTPEESKARAYRGEVSLAGVRFAPIRNALAPDPADAGGKPGVMATDSSRGLVDASMTFSGILDEPQTRTGLGRVRISGGDVVRMPVVMALMQLSNFQLPARDSFDYLQASFQLSGPLVTFDQVALISRTLAITGYGTMSWPGQELDLRFNSRSAGRVPLLSDVVEALRNEVATTRITGTLSEPSIDPEPLMGTRQLIGSALGQPTGPKRSVSEQDADKAARAERDRIKSTSSVPTDDR